jgi:alpha-L-rhamnosidase
MKTTQLTVMALVWACYCPMNMPAAQNPAVDCTVTGLRCEYAENPLGVDVPHPRLFWRLDSQTRGQRQSAYQVLAASSTELLAQDKADLWDSRKVKSDQTTHATYAGKALVSCQQVFWKVRAWDKDGKPSAWSPPGSWTMGLPSEADWQANWIGAAASNTPAQRLAGDHTATSGSQTLLLRHEFDVKPGLRRAVVNVCGLGCYELSLNGRKAGDALFPPGWTKYDKTCLYDTYDVTALLRPGRNAAGLLLGNGMYNVVGGRYTKFTGSFGPLKAIAQLRLEYADGSAEVVGTDGNWRLASGPITFSCVYGGEDYDARLAPAGWNEPGFSDAKWAAACVVKGPGGKLRGLSCSAPPITAFEVLKPVSVKELKPGTAIYDLGQNAALMPRLKVRGTAGSVVKIVPAELLNADGSAAERNAYWKYTLAGKGTESWFPKFFYYGCRYLQVECQAPSGGEVPVVESLEGVVVHAACAPVGEFECSNPLFNRIRTLVRWAQRSNMMSVMTDCPHREKLGWLEEDHLNGPSLRYEFDLAQLFTKVMNDMADSQRPNGLVPDIAPEYVQFRGGFVDSPEWGSAFLLVPWQQYEFTGDLDLLRRHYDGLQRYVAYLGSRATNHIVSHGLGDWYDIGPKPPGVAQLTPIALTATTFYYYDAAILARTAALLGHRQDAARYERLAGQIRDAFNARFFNPTNRQYATGSQCANSIALVMDLVPAASREAVLDAVAGDVRARGNALTAGDVGYRYLLRALAEGGRSDVIFDMNNQSEKPGYGYQLKQGATSLTEAWDAGRASSQNHFMLGQIMEWFYHDLAGIQCDPAGAGFKRIVIHPTLAGDLTWVNGSYRSLHGLIGSRWQREGNRFILEVTIPPNTTATVCVPTQQARQVREGNALARRSPGVRLVREDSSGAVYTVGSGRYVFQAGL